MDIKNGTIEISTRDFGMQSVEENDIIQFPKGIFAFENVKKFVVLSPLGKDNSPMWLQNADEATPCFIVFRPRDFITDYDPQPLAEDMEAIGYEDGDELEYLSIAVIPEDYKKTTINLRSPVVINRSKMKGVQAILPQNYDMRFRIYQEQEA